MLVSSPVYGVVTSLKATNYGMYVLSAGKANTDQQ